MQRFNKILTPTHKYIFTPKFTSGTDILDVGKGVTPANATLLPAASAVANGYMLCDGTTVRAETGIYPTYNTVVTMDCKFQSLFQNNFVGAADTSTGKRFYFGSSNAGKWWIGIGAVAAVSSVVDADTDRHIFVMKAGKLYVDGVMVADASANAFAGTSTADFYIGAANLNNSTILQCTSGTKIYWATIQP